MRATIRGGLFCAAATLLLVTGLTGFILDIVLIAMAIALVMVAIKYVK